MNINYSQNLNLEISAIIEDKEVLESLSSELLSTEFGRQDIGVLDDPEVVKKSLEKKINPKIESTRDTIPLSSHRPPRFHEDHAWLIGFAIAIPMFLGILSGVAFALQSNTSADIYLAMIAGGSLGTSVGAILALYLNSREKFRANKMMRYGGFIIWIHTRTYKQLINAISLLNKHNAKFIEKRALT